MHTFPAFMTTAANAIAANSQSPGVKGWLFQAVDDKQMVYWICEHDGVSAPPHTHDFDDYFVVLQGQFTLQINAKNIVLTKGDEYHIKAGWRIPGGLLRALVPDIALQVCV